MRWIQNVYWGVLPATELSELEIQAQGEMLPQRNRWTNDRRELSDARFWTHA